MEGNMGKFEQIDVTQAKELIGSGNVTIIDIRDSGSYAEAHIHDAIFVNNENIEEFLKSADKSKPLVCYCYHGISSQMAAEYFSEQGFGQVFSMIGGFEQWRSTHPKEIQTEN